MAVHWTTAFKNLLLNAGAAALTHIGLLSDSTTLTTVTAAASTDAFTKTSHGLSDGNIVVLRALTPSSGTGAFIEKAYYVRDSTADTFKLATTSGGSAINISTDITSVTAVKLVEVSGGSPAYARKAIAFATAAEAVADDTTNGATFDVPASTISYLSAWSTISGGTLYGLRALASPITFGGQDTYTINDLKLRLMLDEAA